ncbi:hypothetical protein [Bacillus pretiosus]|uniref:hypothetical protein n=1 Tax=Bacillus TaxID=1386 RepID=UPI003D647C3D
MENLKFQATNSRKHDAPANTVIYSELPAVLIQDSKKAISYYVSAENLKKYEVDSTHTLENTVTFLIPDEEFIGEVPFIQSYENPAVLIEFPKGNTAYLIENKDLESYKIESFEQMSKIAGDCVSFVIPAGDEFLEDIPNMKPAMLQSNCPVTEWPAPLKK